MGLHTFIGHYLHQHLFNTRFHILLVLHYQGLYLIMASACNAKVGKFKVGRTRQETKLIKFIHAAQGLIAFP